MLSGKYRKLVRALGEVIPNERIITDPLRVLAYGTDASFYRLIPKLVLKVSNEAEMRRLLELANRYSVAVTFRAAGTSLSGQAITDSVLIVLEGKAWLEYEIQNGGENILLQPGIIGENANRYLAPLGRKIGPDPASIGTCKIGGIAANNASGLCCGVAQNSYQTLHSMRVIFADGYDLDTSDPDSRARFLEERADLCRQISDLAQSVRDTPVLKARIAKKFSIKNTTGYSLNALVDFEDPIEIIQHLMIGSEGTLGFISAINYHTVVEHPHKASALVFFDDVPNACHAVTQLKAAPVDAVEIMDRAALRSVEGKPGMPGLLANLPDQAAALLIETRAGSDQLLDANIEHIDKILSAVAVYGEVHFTRVPEEIDKLWKVRKGTFPSVGAVRNPGSAVIIEDIAFPIEHLAAGTQRLQELFVKYHYNNAIIFGHALDGNLHFVITPDFANDGEIQRYADFMDEMCHMVVNEYDGSLKAEHSTGRNVAPFVELEWGAEAYSLMKQIKKIFDPGNILNPGVILNDDPRVHLKNLKPMELVDPLIDRCIECGFCEPVCPSRNLSLTPRQRIVGLREIARLRRSAESKDRLDQIESDYDYFGQATCASDGLCAQLCPVEIDTGAMMRRLRATEAGKLGKKIAGFGERNISGITAGARIGLGAAHLSSKVIGQDNLEKISGGIRRLSGNRVPQWHRWMPRGASATQTGNNSGSRNRRCVYFSACVNRGMGAASCDSESRGLQQVIHSLLAKAGFEAISPPDVDSLCCGLPFESKGFEESARASVKRIESALWRASEQGKLPVLCDASPCTARLIKQLDHTLSIQEPATFIREQLLPYLRHVRKVDSVALHVTCSTRQMGLADNIQHLAHMCAEDVFMPEEEGCCGFAGDKGFTLPELNATALQRLREQRPPNCKTGYSNSRGCEIGLSLHSDIPYRSIAYLVDFCFQPNPKCDTAILEQSSLL